MKRWWGFGVEGGEGERAQPKRKSPSMLRMAAFSKSKSQSPVLLIVAVEAGVCAFGRRLGRQQSMLHEYFVLELSPHHLVQVILLDCLTKLRFSLIPILA